MTPFFVVCRELRQCRIFISSLRESVPVYLLFLCGVEWSRGEALRYIHILAFFFWIVVSLSVVCVINAVEI